MSPHLLPFACLAVVAALYGWPLLAQLTTAVPGTPHFPDISENIWNTGWVRHALTTGDPLLRTDALLLPFGADLRLIAFGLTAGLLAFPFTFLLGVVGAFNLVLTLTLFLNGVAAYALFHQQARHRAAALVAACWFMLSATQLAAINVGRPGLGATWAVLGALYVVGSVFAAPRIWKGLILGLFLTAALFSDFQVLLFAAIWLAMYTLYLGWTQRASGLLLRAAGALAIAGLTVLIPFLLVFYPALSGAPAAGYHAPGLDAMAVYSWSIAGYLTPGLWPYVVGGYELVAAAVIAVLVFRRRGSYWFWLAGAVVFLILALGPYLQPTEVPLPFAAFSLWPPLRQFRTPGRLTGPATIGLALVAALLLAYLFRRTDHRLPVMLAALLLIAGKLVFAVVTDSIEVQTYPSYTTYERIAQDPDDFALLEVPFGVRSGFQRIGAGGEIVQYYQHIHGKRLLSGSMGRLPDRVFDFYRSHPSLLLLAGQAPGRQQQTLDADLSEVLRWSQARYVLVHRSLLEADQLRRIEQFLDRHPAIQRLGEEDDLLIYCAEAGACDERFELLPAFPPAD